MQSIEAAWRQTEPAYDRSRLACGVAHLGVGNFMRAHLAVVLHAALQARPKDWLIHGVGLREADVPLVEALQRQDGLYTLTERSGTHDTLRVIGALKELTFAPANPEATIKILASDPVKIISLTVTEKGYTNTTAGDLDLANPEVRADLEGDAPITAVGWLFRACQERLAHRGQPVTLLSCDNVPHNGDLLHRLLTQFAELKNPAVAAWVRANVACPNAMVDRITPAVTDVTRAFVAEQFGVADQAPVVSEAYLQWVLEDRFANGRPRLEEVVVPVQLQTGPVAMRVQFTGDVTPYEQLKMRLLNGAHSALAYPAALLGIQFVDDALRDPALRAFVEGYMDEVTATLPPVPGVDVAAYKRTLIERFANAAVRDQVRRLAEDGSKKIRNFLIPPLETQLVSGGPIRLMTFVLAAWFRFLQGLDEAGRPIPVVDPLGSLLTAEARRNPHDPASFLAVSEIFGDQIAASRRIADAVSEALEAIERLGVRDALVQFRDAR